MAAAGSWGTSISPLGPEAWGQAHVHTPTMGIGPRRPLRWELPGGTCSGNTSQASYQPAKCLISPLESLLRVVTEVSDTRVTRCNRHRAPPGSRTQGLRLRRQSCGCSWASGSHQSTQTLQDGGAHFSRHLKYIPDDSHCREQGSENYLLGWRRGRRRQTTAGGRGTLLSRHFCKVPLDCWASHAGGLDPRGNREALGTWWVM